jgi:hypothetical protein
MAKRAKRKAAKKKSGPAKKRKPAKRAARKAKRAKKRSTKRAVKRKSPGTARSKGSRKIPSEPAGQIGLRRPLNQLKPPGQNSPRELAQAAPDARFDDPRRPQSTAREHPDGSAPPLERFTQYKNTDEPF